MGVFQPIVSLSYLQTFKEYIINSVCTLMARWNQVELVKGALCYSFNSTQIEVLGSNDVIKAELHIMHKCIQKILSFKELEEETSLPSSNAYPKQLQQLSRETRQVRRLFLILEHSREESIFCWVSESFPVSYLYFLSNTVILSVCNLAFLLKQKVLFSSTYFFQVDFNLD